LGAAGGAISNLPYNAATPILLRAVEEEGTFSRVIATVQREVARRFAARPGEEGYGYLSVRAAASGRSLFDLPAGRSSPPSHIERRQSCASRPSRASGTGRSFPSLAFRRGARRRQTQSPPVEGRGSSVERALADVGFDPRRARRSRSEDTSLADRLDLGGARVPLE
jgi:16S rRNA A1518/A1519 N6-dimethyltransferase RsmA/KsgA/DIM1 with predicted DNA glycosylase/AP lyase activity